MVGDEIGWWKASAKSCSGLNQLLAKTSWWRLKRLKSVDKKKREFEALNQLARETQD